jgi:hypothetical protein
MALACNNHQPLMTMLQRCLDRLKLDYKKEKRNNRRGQIATRRNTVSIPAVEGQAAGRDQR